MKLTKRQLKRIIREEYRRVLNENSQPVYDWDMGGIYDMLDHVESELTAEADMAAGDWMMHAKHRADQNPGQVPKEYWQQGGTVRKISDLYNDIAQNFINSGESDESANALYDAFLSKDSPENFEAFVQRHAAELGDISAGSVSGQIPLAHFIWHVLNRNWKHPLS